ncbi:hypothetical protein CDAR_284501 [Caerostris darwini]|uniref:Prolactin receptor n=1 Tax=Caerostris darwini TaxID=1538125 RepID=A0AAV4UJ69_9ARAC|nr:hypothetical protein CDAR_284501 [Caerostris darwini]
MEVMDIARERKGGTQGREQDVERLKTGDDEGRELPHPPPMKCWRAQERKDDPTWSPSEKTKSRDLMPDARAQLNSWPVLPRTLNSDAGILST